MTRDFGLLPDDVKKRLFELEWQNKRNLKARLLGFRPFPISFGLKPPSGNQAMENLVHFAEYVKQWQVFEKTMEAKVIWQQQNYRRLGTQQVPHRIIIENIEQLTEILGPEAKSRQHLWHINMSPLLEYNSALFPILVKHLDSIELLSNMDAAILPEVLKQLTSGMGEGLYLRALPLTGVDTKFVEQNLSLINDLMDMLYFGAVEAAGGLLLWLGCIENPKGWLTIRPLCSESQSMLANLPMLMLSTEQLRSQPLPASNILVVENLASGFGLPELRDTIAVFGGGKNVAWMDGDWLKNKKVAYWGDLDTHGLAFLADARNRLPTVTPLMMDLKTLKKFESRMAEEDSPVSKPSNGLTEKELTLFEQLKSGHFDGTRLEQERLSPDFIEEHLKAWLGIN